MDEFIKKLIGRLGEEKQACHINAEVYTERKIGKIIEIVKELAEEYNNSSTNTSTWISVDDRLPEDTVWCLVTVMDCNPATLTDFENILPCHVGYDGETWNDEDGNVIPFEVLAWMPLPEPFEQKGE